MSEALVLRNVHKSFYEKEHFDKKKGHTSGVPGNGGNGNGSRIGQIFRTIVGTARGVFSPPSKVRVLENINITVGNGEIFGLLGPNGSGKSTLIRLVATLLLPDQGEITVFGQSVLDNPREIRRYLNRVSVEASLFRKLNAMENLTYAARLYGVEVESGLRATEQVLYEFGLKHRDLYTSVENLSRGMQQKVAIARALMTSPMLLLLDEPTTGLDPRSKREVQDFILNVRNINDTTVILTTHDMVEAEKLCDRIAIISKGKIIACGTCDELKALSSREESSLEDLFLDLTGEQLTGDTEKRE